MLTIWEGLWGWQSVLLIKILHIDTSLKEVFMRWVLISSQKNIEQETAYYYFTGFLDNFPKQFFHFLLLTYVKIASGAKRNSSQGWDPNICSLHKHHTIRSKHLTIRFMMLDHVLPRDPLGSLSAAKKGIKIKI